MNEPGRTVPPKKSPRYIKYFSHDHTSDAELSAFTDAALAKALYLDGSTSTAFSEGGSPAEITIPFDGGVASTIF